MPYEISKFPFKAELASASFNAKFEEIETDINNLSSEVETLRTENQELRQLLNNKVELNELTLINGWQKAGQTYYGKTIGKTVICSARIKKNIPAVTGEFVAQLPVGFRTIQGGQWAGYATENDGSGQSKNIGLFITTDGKIGVDTLGVTTLKCLMFTLVFVSTDI